MNAWFCCCGFFFIFILPIAHLCHCLCDRLRSWRDETQWNGKSKESCQMSFKISRVTRQLYSGYHRKKDNAACRLWNCVLVFLFLVFTQIKPMFVIYLQIQKRKNQLTIFDCKRCGWGTRVHFIYICRRLSMKSWLTKQ